MQKSGKIAKIWNDVENYLVDLEKMLQNELVVANVGLDTAENGSRNRSKNKIL